MIPHLNRTPTPLPPHHVNQQYLHQVRTQLLPGPQHLKTYHQLNVLTVPSLIMSLSSSTKHSKILPNQKFKLLRNLHHHQTMPRKLPLPLQRSPLGPLPLSHLKLFQIHVIHVNSWKGKMGLKNARMLKTQNHL